MTAEVARSRTPPSASQSPLRRDRFRRFQPRKLDGLIRAAGRAGMDQVLADHAGPRPAGIWPLLRFLTAPDGGRSSSRVARPPFPQRFT
jgi:hypothetical protein